MAIKSRKRFRCDGTIYRLEDGGGEVLVEDEAFVALFILACTIALERPAVGLTPKFGNGGAIMRLRKMKAASAARPIISDTTLSPKRGRGSVAFVMSEARCHLGWKFTIGRNRRFWASTIYSTASRSRKNCEYPVNNFRAIRFSYPTT
jgi:hypothetical protein